MKMQTSSQKQFKFNLEQWFKGDCVQPLLFNIGYNKS